MSKIAMSMNASRKGLWNKATNNLVNDQRQAVDRICNLVADDVKILTSKALAINTAIQAPVTFGGPDGKKRNTSAGGWALMTQAAAARVLERCKPLVDEYFKTRHDIAQRLDAEWYKAEVAAKNGEAPYNEELSGNDFLRNVDLKINLLAVKDDREVVQQIIDDAGLHDVCTLGVKLPDGEEFLQETLNAITVQIAVWWNLLMEMNSPNPPAKRKIASIIENATEQAEKLRDIGDPTLDKVADFIEQSVLPALRTKATFKMPTCADFGVPDGAITIAAEDLPEGATVPPMVEVGDMDF